MSEVTVWGDFEIHFGEVLGRGGMGTVYKARQRSLDRWVAVKVLDTSRAPDPALAQGFLERFHVEARALASLQDPRIVTILQAGENEGRCWFAMELIEGVTAEQRLIEKGAFPEEEARRIALEVARALDAAFRQGIIHRDVKPGNIFLCADGSVKLGDFGLARGERLSPTRLTDPNAVACTPAYAAPEQGDGRQTDHRSDIYSLGCVLYEMVTERPPFVSDSPMETLFKHASEQPIAPCVLNPALSHEFEAALLKCLAKDPDARYQSYAELLAALDRPRLLPAREWFWPSAAAAGATLLAVIVAAVFMNAGAPEVPVAKRVPLPLPAKEPAPPLPISVTPSSPAEERAVEPPELPFSAHRPAPEELQLIRRILAPAERWDAAIQEGRYDDALAALAELRADSRQTPYTLRLLEAEDARLRTAARLRAAFEESLRPGRKAELRLADGRIVAGTVVPAEAGLIAIQTSAEKVAFTRRDIAEESVWSRAKFEDALLYRATHGDPRGALGALRLRVDPSLEPHLAGLVHGAALRAAASLESRGAAIGRAVLEDIDAQVKLLPESLSYVGEPALFLAYETAAAEAFEGKDFEKLVADYERSRAYPRALREVLAGFSGQARRERVAGAEMYAWEFHPFEEDLRERQRHIYEDPREKAIVLDQPEGRRAMIRRVPEARDGFVFEYLLEGKEAAWEVAAGGVELQGSDGHLALLAAGKVAIPASSGWGRVAVIPLGKHLLVYHGKELAFKAPLHQLDEVLHIRVNSGRLKVRSLKVCAFSDE